MSRYIKSEQLFFVRHFLMLAPGRDRSSSSGRCRSRQFIKQRNLSGGAIAMGSSRSSQRLVDASEEFGSLTAQEIEGTGFDQTFEHLAIGDARAQTPAKIIERSKVPSPFPFADRQFHGAFTHMLDRGQTVAAGA